MGCRGLAGGCRFNDEEGPLLGGGAPGRVGLDGTVGSHPPQKTRNHILCCDTKSSGGEGKIIYTISPSVVGFEVVVKVIFVFEMCKVRGGQIPELCVPA